MNGAETRAEHIDPALKAAGWGIVEGSKILREETQRLARLYERKLAALEALKKSLLHQAFTGGFGRLSHR